MRKMIVALFAFSVIASAHTTHGLDTHQNLPKPDLKPSFSVPKPPPVKAAAVGIVQKNTGSCEYGTHILKVVPDYPGNKEYCLQSNDVHLRNYIGKKVRVSGELISGSPNLMNVTSVDVIYP